MTREFTRREHQGAAAPDESCEQRNKRMGWGCACHGQTFCPDLVCVGYEDDVPVFERAPPAGEIRLRLVSTVMLPNAHRCSAPAFATPSRQGN